MKKIQNKTIVRSIVSFFTLGIFLLIAVSSMSERWIKTTEFDGTYFIEKGEQWEYIDEDSPMYPTGRCYMKICTKDSYGRYDGYSWWDEYYENMEGKTKYWQDAKLQREEKGGWSNGCRQGVWTITKYSITSQAILEEIYIRYEKGKVVSDDKSQSIPHENPSSYQILNAKYPWLIPYYEFLGTDSIILHEYVDSMEFYINSFPYDVNEFEDYYYDAREILYENPRYDTTFFVANNTLIKEFGFEKLKNAELRLAILDRYYMNEEFTFPILQSRYPGYIDFLHLIAETEFEDAAFEAFCNKLDKRIESYGPLDTTDPFFTDSIDTRLSRAIDELADEENDEEVAQIVVQETVNYLKSCKKIKTSFNREIENLIIKKAREANTDELAELVAMSFYMVYLSADYVKECLNDAYLVKGSIARQPVATTSIENIDASGSATIKGWIHEDGGASVTERGVVWGTTYNPTIDDEVETSGNGLGEFLVTLSGLSEGVTYFARTYATNSAGTAFGNLVRFTTADQGASVELMENPRLTIYPNPAVNTIHFLNSFNEQSNSEFSIYNTRGSLVFRKNISGKQKEIVTIDISELENGFYSCVLTNGTRAAKESIIVAH